MSVRISRRQLLVGVGALGLGGAGLYGRYALGDTFESHVADLIGLNTRVTGELLAGVREEQGTPDYDVRAAALLAATTFPGRLAMPREARREAVESFLGPLVDLDEGLLTPYVLAGIQQSGRSGPCGGQSRA